MWDMCCSPVDQRPFFFFLKERLDVIHSAEGLILSVSQEHASAFSVS